MLGCGQLGGQKKVERRFLRRQVLYAFGFDATFLFLVPHKNIQIIVSQNALKSLISVTTALIKYILVFVITLTN